MNFENAQSLWSGQPVPDLSTPGLVERQHALVRELKRRQRFLGYGIFGITFGLIAFPSLTLLNYLSAPRLGTPLFWTGVALHLFVLLTFATSAVRRLRRHGELRRASTGTLRQQAEVALAHYDLECREYRAAPWVFALWTVLSLISIYNNSPFHGGSWEAIGVRVAMVAGLQVVVGAVLWRHYRVNLLPARDRQSEILRQLG